MVLDGEPLTSMPSPERFISWTSYFWPYLVSSRPWRLTSKSYQYFVVSTCTQVINLAKFPQAVC